MNSGPGISFIKSLGKGSIGRHLVIAVLVFSTFITFSTTAIQLYFDYRHDLKAIEGYFNLIEKSYIDSLSRSVWMYDESQISAQLDGLLKLPDIEHLEIEAGQEYRWASGISASRHPLSRSFPLHFRHQNRDFDIGVLKVTASLDNVYDRLIGKAITILATNAVRAFFVSGFILLIFQYLVTRHLIELADQVKTIELDSQPNEIELSKKKGLREPDEIDRVVHALNETQAKLRQSYNALRHSQEELSRIFTLSIDPICIADIETATFIKVNPAFTETLGFTEKELTSRPFLSFIHPDDVAKTLDTIEEDLKSGKKVINFENRYRTKDGGYRWLRWVSHPLPEKGVTYAVAHDITAIKASMNELQSAHRRFLTVLDAIDAHIHVADMKSHEILFMNTKMQEDFGRDLIGQVCWSAFRGQKAPCPECTNPQLVDEAGQPGEVCSWRGQNPVTGRWYMNHDRAIRWVDERVVRIQIAMDITQLITMEEELRQAHKLEAIGTLAGGIAHEFNNIISIIIGNAELAVDDIPKGNPARSNLEEIKSAGLRAKAAVQQLLSYSRKPAPQSRPVDAVREIEKALQLVRESIPDTIEIRSNIESGLGSITAEAGQIQQVVIHLCTNAVQAMKDGGFLTIGLRSLPPDEKRTHAESRLTGPCLQLTVKDTGEGIAPDIKEKIFNPYFTTREVGEGSGMGLAIVQGIVMKQNGVISVESEPGIGTKVTVLLPMVLDMAPGI